MNGISIMITWALSSHEVFLIDDFKATIFLAKPVHINGRKFEGVIELNQCKICARWFSQYEEGCSCLTTTCNWCLDNIFTLKGE